MTKTKIIDLEVTGHAAYRARTRIEGSPQGRVLHFLDRRLRSEDTIYLDDRLGKHPVSRYYDNKYAVIYVCKFCKPGVKLITVTYPDCDPRYSAEEIARQERKIAKFKSKLEQKQKSV